MKEDEESVREKGDRKEDEERVREKGDMKEDEERVREKDDRKEDEERVMKRKGWGYISHWREFMEGSRVRGEWFRDGLHCKEGEGRDALTKGIGRGVMQWVEGAGKQRTGN